MKVEIFEAVQAGTRRDTTAPERGFTLTELLVVLATLGVLVLVAWPALAGIQNRGGVAQCAGNLRRIGMESMVYANEYNGWLPIVDIGGANTGGQVDRLPGIWYGRWMWLGTPDTHVSETSTNFQNLGLLYQARLTSNGKQFYCPAQWNSPPGANTYRPLFTSDASGYVRTSYEFNPRLVYASFSQVNYSRRYQKTSQLVPHKLLAVDYLENPTGSLSAGIPFQNLAHSRERGWNVLFSDGSVQFCQDARAYYLATHRLITDESSKSLYLYDYLFNLLEQDH